MTQPTKQELAQAIRDLRTIGKMFDDKESLDGQIRELRDSVDSVSNRMNFPCAIKINGVTALFLNSLSIKDLVYIQVYDLDSGVSNHDDTSDASN